MYSELNTVDSCTERLKKVKGLEEAQCRVFKEIGPKSIAPQWLLLPGFSLVTRPDFNLCVK